MVLLCVVVGVVQRDTAGLEILNAPVGNTNAPEGMSFTFSVLATGEEPLTYQWFKQASPIAGANSAELTLPNPQRTDSGIYEVTVSDASGNSRRAGVLLLVRPRIPEIGLSPSPNLPIPAGTSLRLYASVSGVAPITYQWYKNGEPVSGATGSEFDLLTGFYLPNITEQDAGDYTVTVSNAYGASTSEPITITVGDPPVEKEPVIVVHPFSLNMRPGETAAIEVVAKGASPLMYQWFKDGQSIPGATNAFYWFRNASVSQSGSYTVVVQNSFGSVTSNPSTVMIAEPPPPDPRIPVVTRDPQSPPRSLEEGSSLQLSVVASGEGVLSYQWYRNANPIFGAVSPTYEQIDLQVTDSGSYHVLVSNEFGSTRSRDAFVNVLPRIPRMIVSPDSADWIEGAYATLTAHAVGIEPITYQWYRNGQVVSNSFGGMLHVMPAQPSDAGSYHAVASNPYGSANSAVATVTVGLVPAPPVIWSFPSNPIYLNRGEPLVLTAYVSGSRPMEFQWFRNNVPVAGGNSSTLTIEQSEIADTGEYYLTATNSLGSAISSVLKVTVLGAPIITVQPAGKVDLLSSELPYLLTVEATGGFPLRFIWYRDGQLVSESWGQWISVEKARNSFPIYGWADNGDYTVVAINSLGTARSEPARVEVKVPSPKRPPSAEAPDLLAGLVAYWPFDEIAGDRTKDVVGQYDLKLEASPSYLTPYLEAGRMGSALPLEQTATYNVQDSGDELPVNKHGAFTVSFWTGFVRRTGWAPEHVLFYEGSSEDEGTFFSLSAPLQPSSLYSSRFQIARQPAEGTDFRGSSIILSDRYWHHLAIVQDVDGSRWFYIDGEEDALPLPKKAPGAWNLDFLRFGGVVVPGADRLSAKFGPVPNDYKLDDAAVWKRALTLKRFGF